MKTLYLFADQGVNLSGVKGAPIHVPSFVQALAGPRHIRRRQHNESLRNELGRNARMARAKKACSQSAEQVIAWVEPLLRHKTCVCATSPQHAACDGRMRQS